MLSPSTSRSVFSSHLSFKNPNVRKKPQILRIEMRDRSKNRRPTQRGRYLSSEAILAVQTLKRSKSTLLLDRSSSCSQSELVGPKLQRLIKADMVAVMRELITQSEPLLAILVFEEIRKEHWYKPKLSIYTDLITILARCNLKKELEQICGILKTEYYLEPDLERFNILIGALLEFGFLYLAMDFYRLMKLWECEPDEITYKILINGLEARGEMDISHSIRCEAQSRFGESLDFLKEIEETSIDL